MFNMHSKVFRSRGMKFVFALTILVITTIAGGSVIKTQERDDLIEVFKDRLAGELLQEVRKYYYICDSQTFLLHQF